MDLGLRFFRRRKAAAAVAVLTVSLALAANTAAFAVVRAFLLSHLGVPEADRVYAIAPVRELPGRGAVVFADAYPNYLLLRDTQRTFANVACAAQGSASWDDGGEARPLRSARVTASFFPTMRVAPMLGRAFREDEEGPQPAAVAIVSHAFWRTALGADPAVVGRTLRIDDAPYTIVGVMPPRFEQPVATEAWLPFDIPAPARTTITGARQLALFGRLRDGMEHPAAVAEMEALTRRALDLSAENKDYRYQPQTLRESLTNGADAAVLLVQAGAAVLLLLAVANLTSLLIAWGVERRQELAVRRALGAGDARVAGLLVAQSLVVVGLGAAGGGALAWAALPLIRRFNPNPAFAFFMSQLEISAPVVLVSAVCAVGAGLAAGVLPAWVGQRTDPAHALGGSSRGFTLSRTGLRWQQAMVAVQVALSVVILSAATLVGLSFRNLSRVPSGFDPAGRVVLQVQLPERTYGRHEPRVGFAQSLREHLAAEAELAAAGWSTTLPVGDVPTGGRFYLELPDGSVADETQLLHFRRISPEYLSATGIPLVRGRPFDTHDDAAAPAVAIVSQAVAERFWPGADPLGRVLHRATAGGAQRQALEVVGVVGNTQDAGFSAPAGEAVYVPYSQTSAVRLSIVARGRSGPKAAAAAVRRALKATDPVLAVTQERTLDDLVGQANALPRLQTVLLATFAIVAIGLVALGSYGTMRQLVASREREFALRLAMGAVPANLGRSVLTQLSRLTLPGVGVGVGVAWWLGGGLRAFAFGIEPRSAAVLAIAGAAVFALASVAAVPSAIQAMRVDVRRTFAA